MANKLSLYLGYFVNGCYKHSCIQRTKSARYRLIKYLEGTPAFQRSGKPASMLADTLHPILKKKKNISGRYKQIALLPELIYIELDLTSTGIKPFSCANGLTTASNPPPKSIGTRFSSRDPLLYGRRLNPNPISTSSSSGPGIARAFPSNSSVVAHKTKSASVLCFSVLRHATS